MERVTEGGSHGPALANVLDNMLVKPGNVHSVCVDQVHKSGRVVAQVC